MTITQENIQRSLRDGNLKPEFREFLVSLDARLSEAKMVYSNKYGEYFIESDNDYQQWLKIKETISQQLDAWGEMATQNRMATPFFITFKGKGNFTVSSEIRL